MATLEKVFYTAKAHTTGGRDGGSSRTDDGRLDVQLSDPGTSSNGTNPEQLFAVGWSACFLSALKLVAQKKKVPFPTEAAVDAEVDLGLAQGGLPPGSATERQFAGRGPANGRVAGGCGKPHLPVFTSDQR